MYGSDKEALEALNGKHQALLAEISKVIVGQEHVIREVTTAVFAGGHVLLVGVPGLAKTLLVNTIAQALGLSFNRVQFTPDLMPSDIVGSEILDEARHFKFMKGPLFANIVLADEINRTPPKTQSALLEAMQERAVTVAGQTYPLPAPFFVLATQNPIEQEGTYPLPEAQLDRFMFNTWVDYPTYEEELSVVKATTADAVAEVNPVISGEEILFFQQLIRRMPIADNVLEYAVGLAGKTRPGRERATDTVNAYLSWGAGPRASQYLVVGAKVNAALNGKFSPDIEDVKAVATPILRHRIVRNYKAEAEGHTVESIIRRAALMVERKAAHMSEASAGDGVFAILKRVYALLNAGERRFACGLLGLVLVNSLVDLLGLAAVIPVIGLVVEPELLASNPLIAGLFDFAYAFGCRERETVFGSFVRIACCRFFVQNGVRDLDEPHPIALWVSRGTSAERRVVDAPFFRFAGAHAIQRIWAHSHRNQFLARAIRSGVCHRWPVVFQ